MESYPTQAVLPLVGAAADKVVRDRYLSAAGQRRDLAAHQGVRGGVNHSARCFGGIKMFCYWSHALTTAATWIVLLAAAPSVEEARAARAVPHARSCSGADDLAAMALEAKSEFQPLSSEHVSRARARLRRAIDKLEAFLSTGTPRNTANWKEYLQWEAMWSELETGDGPNVRRLDRILSRYYRNHPSLEHPTFIRMRTALLEYRNAVAMARDPKLAERYEARLEKLAAELAEYRHEPTMQTGRTIGNLVGWLERAEQAEGLVAAIRERYWQPNCHASISERLVNARMAVDIEETDDIQDCILGTLMLSTATMRGRTGVELVDSAEDAHIRLLVNGVTESDNVGYNRGVRILSHSQTSVNGTKAIHMDAEGLSFKRSQVHCETESTIDGIAARSRLVASFARRQAFRTKSQAEAIGSRRAEARMVKRIDRRADELLEKARKRYQERFRKPLLRRGEFPRELTFRTANDRLQIAWCQVSSSQLAAPDTPRTTMKQHDLSLHVHESFVSNFSRAVLAGLRVTDEYLVELLEKNGLPVPDTVRPSNDKEPWAITFSTRDPLSASFADDKVRLAIRGGRFQLGNRVVDKELEMSAVYKLEKTASGAHLARQGEVSADYLYTEGRLSTEEIVVRTVMRQKFEAIFAPEFETTGIELSEDWGREGMLRLQTLIPDGHWLSLAWAYVPSGN
ncbi:MAG: hypothetical protein ACQESR_04630 [Planctomycetota bacterium]